MPSLSNIKFYYFPIPGRGEFVRLLLDDAGLDYEVVQVTSAEWPKLKADLLAQGVPAPTMPYITVDGNYIGKTAPIMRYVSKQLGDYLAGNDLDNALLDSLVDISLDWFRAWLAKGSGPESKDKYYSESGTGTMYHKSIENVLAKSNGPYVLGEKISYADFFIYHTAVVDELRQNIDNSKYPHLKKFFEAIESRPSLQKHFGKSQ